jgi:hypothetical protein
MLGDCISVFVQAGGKVMARWKPPSVRKTNNRDSVKIFDHPRNETNVAAGGEKSKDRTPKSSAKKATTGLDMPANRYEALPRFIYSYLRCRKSMFRHRRKALPQSEARMAQRKQRKQVSEWLRCWKHRALRCLCV